MSMSRKAFLKMFPEQADKLAVEEAVRRDIKFQIDETQKENDKPPSKYNSRKIEIDGITFDSEREARYSQGLDILAKAGEINSITYQPTYILQEKFRKNGKGIRAINYIADFEVEYADGRTEIVDVKGFKTPVFRLKQKLFEYKYPNLTLKEV